MDMRTVTLNLEVTLTYDNDHVSEEGARNWLKSTFPYRLGAKYDPRTVVVTWKEKDQ
jgi:hypothetical protein